MAQLCRWTLWIVMLTSANAMADTHYVLEVAESQFPYTNRTHAATNVQQAVDAAESGDTVFVGNGTFRVSPQLAVTQGIVVASESGAAATVLDGCHSNRVAFIGNSCAVLDGFTITNGYILNTGSFALDGSGAGVLCVSGLVRNCLITGNTISSSQPLSVPADGGGFACGPWGVFLNCVVEGNSSQGGAGGGGCAGLVMNCTVRGNTAEQMGGLGVVFPGQVLHSVIEGNRARFGAGVGLAEGGVITDSLIVSNQAAEFGGGVGVFSGGRVVNCTIAGNTASNGAGISCAGVGEVVNTIVHGNSPDNCVTGSAFFSHCSTVPSVAGPGNMTNAPRFINAAAGDYHLSAGSPCIDAGTGSNAPDRDLDGMPRPLDGDSNGVAAVDMGAYEFSVWETKTHYVSLSGAHEWPYTNWITAATNIQAAVDATTSGETVLVANGTFKLDGEISVGTNLIVRSANGADETLVDGCQTTRCFRLLPGAGCSVRGFTIANGNSAGDCGGGVRLGAGNTLADCVIAACTAGFGGGVYATLGTVSNCSFLGNAANHAGGGIYSDGGSVIDSTFTANEALCGGGIFSGPITNLTNVVAMLSGNADLFSNVVGQLNYVGRVLTNMLSQLPSGQVGVLKTSALSAPGWPLTTARGCESYAFPRDIVRCLVVSNTAAYGGGLFLLDTPGLVVSNCLFAGNEAQSGGGMCAQNGGDIRDTTFADNDAASLGGGAIVLDTGLLDQCSFVSNRAAIAGGGAMLASFGMMGITNIAVPLALSASGVTVLRVQSSDFFGNSAESIGGGLMLAGGGTAGSNTISRNDAPWGGGIADWGGAVQDSSVTSNSSSFGGGCFTIGGSVSNCVLKGNQAVGVGGGIFALPTQSGVTIRNCQVTDNSAMAGGGLGLSESAQAEACAIKSNSAEIAGGGVFSVLGGDLRSSLVQGNTAPDGGGVYCLDGGRILNSTITANFSSNAGGGLCVASNAPGGPPSLKNATIANTIIYGNVASTAANVLNIGTNVSYSYCCTFPAPEPGGVGNITNAPQLTPTGRLKRTSPCIDAGTDSNAPPTDIDGEARWDDPKRSNAVSIVDIGADEFVDIDLDSMADCWETGCFGGITNRNGAGDFDNDSLIDLAEYEHSTNPTNSDTDADQLPDGWEVANGINPLSNMDDNGATGDPDGDGADNLTEYIADTQPTNADSVLRIFTIKPEHGGMRIDWKGGIQAWQVLDCREDLTNTNEEWLPLLCLPPPTQTTNAVIDMGATNRVFFYRIRAER